LNSVRPVIEAWRKPSKDSSPDALMVPAFGRGERKGQAVPRWEKNYTSGCSAKAQTVRGQRKPSTSRTAFSSWMHLIFFML
jgi:hypothetical protein